MTVVNLNKARKAKARADKTERAAANAVKFGRTKLEKKNDTAQLQTARRHLDLHKRDTP